MLLELLEMKLRPESTGARWAQSREKGLGWDLQGPEGEERGLHRI